MLVLSFVLHSACANKSRKSCEIHSDDYHVIMIRFISKYLHLPLCLYSFLDYFTGKSERLDSVKWIHKLNPEMLHGKLCDLKKLLSSNIFSESIFLFIVWFYLKQGNIEFTDTSMVIVNLWINCIDSIYGIENSKNTNFASGIYCATWTHHYLYLFLNAAN